MTVITKKGLERTNLTVEMAPEVHQAMKSRATVMGVRLGALYMTAVQHFLAADKPRAKYPFAVPEDAAHVMLRVTPEFANSLQNLVVERRCRRGDFLMTAALAYLETEIPPASVSRPPGRIKPGRYPTKGTALNAAWEAEQLAGE